MKVIPIKGTIVSNNDSWIYDWFGWDYTAPKNVTLPETGEDIEVHINSGGGDVVEISPTAQIMIHNVSSNVSGDHNTLLHEAGVLEGFNKSIANAYVDKTGKALDDLLNLMNKTTWFDAKSAVKEGFADRVMFSGEIAPTFAASEIPMIPHDFIDKMKSAMTPDVDKLAELVANELEARQIEKETFENSEFVQKKFNIPESPENNTNETVPKGFGLFAF